MNPHGKKGAAHMTARDSIFLGESTRTCPVVQVDHAEREAGIFSFNLKDALCVSHKAKGSGVVDCLCEDLFDVFWKGARVHGVVLCTTSFKEGVGLSDKYREEANRLEVPCLLEPPVHRFGNV